jgi:required for meiotic nuclear division protein 1
MLRRLVDQGADSVRIDASKKLPVIACCTADSYHVDILLPALQQHCQVYPIVSEDVLVAKMQNNDTVYFFLSGSFVVWSNSSTGKDVVARIRQLISTSEQDPLKTVEVEEMEYSTTESESSISGEEVILLNNDVESSKLREQLAFSNGLADSVKIASMESAMESHIEQIEVYPKAMQNGQSLGLDRKKVLRLSGQLLAIRSAVNLRSQLTDPPELYWSDQRLDSLYHLISKLLENRKRISVLNAKMDYAGELQNIISIHISSKHSTNLELGIIGLITIEVIFETLHFFA